MIKHCDCCAYKTEVKEYPIRSVSEKSTCLLCKICAKTFLGNCIVYTSLSKNRELFGSIGWIANHLQDLIIKGTVYREEMMK